MKKLCLTLIIASLFTTAIVAQNNMRKSINIGVSPIFNLGKNADLFKLGYGFDAGYEYISPANYGFEASMLYGILNGEANNQLHSIDIANSLIAINIIPRRYMGKVGKTKFFIGIGPSYTMVTTKNNISMTVFDKDKNRTITSFESKISTSGISIVAQGGANIIVSDKISFCSSLSWTNYNLANNLSQINWKSIDMSYEEGALSHIYIDFKVRFRLNK